MSDLIKRDDAPEPCPFCRGKATIYWGSDEWTDADCYQVICDSCDVKGKEYKSREEAIAAWNTRALPISATAAELEGK
jgi:Lar family restriction alleviation protein